MKSQIILAILAVVVIVGGLVAYKERHVLKSMMGGSTPTETMMATSPAPTAAAMEATSPAALGASGAVPATAGATKSFTVTGSNFSFDPKQITVAKDDTVTITFKNADGFHDWNLDEFNVHTKKIQGGTQDTVTFTANKTGTFEYYCSVGNHRQMGMVGKLIVQ